MCNSHPSAATGSKYNAKRFLHLPESVKSLVPKPQSQGLPLLLSSPCSRGPHVSGQNSFVRRFRIFCRRSHLSPILRSSRAHSTTCRSAGNTHGGQPTHTAACPPRFAFNFCEILAILSILLFFLFLNTTPPPPLQAVTVPTPSPPQARPQVHPDARGAAVAARSPSAEAGARGSDPGGAA